MISGHKALSEHYKAILPSDITSFDSVIVELDFSDAGDVAIPVMEFQAMFSTPNGQVENGGVIFDVLEKIRRRMENFRRIRQSWASEFFQVT